MEKKNVEKALIFDAFNYVRRLKEVGFTELQAVVQAEH